MTLPNLAKHASESGHFYAQDGSQVEGVPYADKKREGELRKPTLKDAKKNGWCRGVTSIIGNAHRGGLETWKIDQGIMAALRIDRERGMDNAPHYQDKAYIAEIRQASKDLSISTADEGTRIHAAIQAHFQGQPFDEAYQRTVDAFLWQLEVVCGPRDWQAELPVVSKLGYATKIDLVSGEWLLDTKTKDGNEEALRKLKLYDDYPMQLAAGGHAYEDTTGETPACYANVLVSRDHPGVVVIRSWPAQDIERGWGMFESLLDFTFLKDKHKPEWAE